MNKLGQALMNFLKNEDGPTSVEYAVMLGVLVVIGITAYSSLGTTHANTNQSALQKGPPRVSKAGR